MPRPKTVPRPPVSPDKVREREKHGGKPRPGENYRPDGEKERLIADHAKALELRKSGLSYREIARRMNRSVNTVHGYIQSELLFLREQTSMDAESVRDMELERLDQLQSSLWSARKDPSVAGTIIRIMERRAKLLGIDAPTRTELVGALAAVTPETAAKMSDSDISARVRALLGRIEASTKADDPDGSSSPPVMVDG